VGWGGLYVCSCACVCVGGWCLGVCVYLIVCDIGTLTIRRPGP